MNLNFQIFWQAFLHQFWPLTHETTLDSIYQFHPENYVSAAAIAGIGSLLAAVFMYGIGIWLRRLPARISTPEQQVRIEHLRLIANQWLAWALLLAGAPFGMLLVVAAGFFGIQRWRSLFMVIVAELLWRGLPLLS